MHVAITMGMTVEDVREQFDIPRLQALNNYCEKFPPQHILIAGYFGFPKEKKIASESEADLAAAMMQMQEVKR